MIKQYYNLNLELLKIYIDKLLDLELDLQTDVDINFNVSDDDELPYILTLNLPIYIKHIPERLGSSLLSIDNIIFEHITITNIGIDIEQDISIQRCLLNYGNTVIQKGFKESSIYVYIDKTDLTNIKYGLAIFLHHGYLKRITAKDSLRIAIDEYTKSLYTKYEMMYNKYRNMKI